MRLATIRTTGPPRAVLVVEGGAVDLGARLGQPIADVGQLLVEGRLVDAVAASSEPPDVDLDEVEWLPPVLRPDHIFCVGLNYAPHREETGRPVVDHPTIFLRAASSQVGHLQPLVLPSASTKLDYEGELAVVIGRGGRHIRSADAVAHLAGVACYDDGSVRDFQNHTSQWTPGKNFARTGGFGPAVVTMDEVDLAALELATRVNGEELQRAKVAEMIFDVGELIAYVSTFCELQPGDVIVTGTPGGVGFLRDPPRFLRSGDFVEVEITGVGTLCNPVEPEEAR